MNHGSWIGGGCGEVECDRSLLCIRVWDLRFKCARKGDRACMAGVRKSGTALESVTSGGGRAKEQVKHVWWVLESQEPS